MALSRYGVCGCFHVCFPCCYHLPPLLQSAIERDIETFDVLQLRESELFQLWDVFVAVDRDMAGEISLEEFFDHCDLQETSIVARRAFALFDIDHNGKIDFCEFAITLWNYCTFDHQALVLFAFDLYDLDNSGSISVKEIRKILTEVYGKAKKELIDREALKIERELGMAMRKTEEEMTEQESLEASRRRFRDFVEHHSAILMPVYTLQRRLQSRCGGTGFWSRISRRRKLRMAVDQRVRFDRWKHLLKAVSDRRGAGKEAVEASRRERRRRARQAAREQGGCCGPRKRAVIREEDEFDPFAAGVAKDEGDIKSRMPTVEVEEAPAKSKSTREREDKYAMDELVQEWKDEKEKKAARRSSAGPVPNAATKKAMRRLSMAAALNATTTGGGVLQAARAATRRRRASAEDVSEADKERIRQRMKNAAHRDEDFPYDRADRTAAQKLEKIAQGKQRAAQNAEERKKRRRASLTFLAQAKGGNPEASGTPMASDSNPDSQIDTQQSRQSSLPDGPDLAKAKAKGLTRLRRNRRAST